MQSMSPPVLRLHWSHWRIASQLHLAIAIAILASITGCSESSRDSRPNIILISLDTVRADHLSSYGYWRDTTPQFDAFASVATRYSRAYAPGPWTYTSHIEMLTGQIPQEIGVYTGDTKIPKSTPIFSEHLSRAGYRLAAFVDSRKSGYVGGRRGFRRGFKKYRYAPYRENMPFEFDVKATFAEGVRWIEGQRRKKRPFGLFLHTKTAHKIKEDWAHEDERTPPYDVPSDRFRFVKPEHQAYSWQDPELGVGGQLLTKLNDAYLQGQRKAEDFDREQLEALESLYDSALHRIDEAFGELVTYLREARLYDNSLIIVTADHGEEFLEHGQFNHRQLFQETTRVPLIVKFPHDDVGRVVDRNVRLADIVPTVLAHAGIERPQELHGVVLDGREESIDPDRPIFGAHYAQRRAEKRKRQHLSLRRGDWTLVVRTNTKTGENGVELFDRSVDPDEMQPVVDQPQRLAAMHAELEAWRGSWLPLANEKVDLDEETREHLRALGYAE